MTKVKIIKEYESDRLLLRVLDPSCGKLVLDFYKDNIDLIRKWEPEYLPVFYTVGYQEYLLKCAVQLYENMDGLSLWVFRKEDEETPIGHVSVTDVVKGVYRSADSGYKIIPDYQGRGYASEALTRAIKIGFEDWDLQRIQACVMPENLPSVRVLQKCGFEYEGVRRQHMYIRGAWHDFEVYSVLRPSDLPPLTPVNI